MLEGDIQACPTDSALCLSPCVAAKMGHFGHFTFLLHLFWCFRVGVWDSFLFVTTRAGSH